MKTEIRSWYNTKVTAVVDDKDDDIILPQLPKNPDPSNQEHVKLLYDYAAQGLVVEFTDGEENLYFIGISKEKTLCVECTVNGEDWHHLYYDKLDCTGRALDFDYNYHDVAVEG